MNGHERQKEQSAKLIEDALFSLMREKNFERITVSELAGRADVARRTFYRLYQSKEDVLRRYLEKLRLEYQRTCPPLKRYDFIQIAEEYFGFWYRYREELLLLHKCGLDQLLYYEMSRASLAVVKGRMEGNTDQEEWEIACFAGYSTGGFLLLLQRWVESGMQENPKQYARMTGKALLRFIRPVMVRGNEVSV